MDPPASFPTPAPSSVTPGLPRRSSPSLPATALEQLTMAARLPLEMQLYILELALPPQTLRRLPARRLLIKQFSLLHRDYTKPMQRLLYAIPHLDINGTDVAMRMKEKLDAADAVEAVVTGLDLTVRKWADPEVRTEVLELLKSRASTVRELAVYLRTRDFPFWGEFLPKFVSLNVAGLSAESIARYPAFSFPPRLSRLLLQRCGNDRRSHFHANPDLVLPTISTLRTLLIGPKVYLAPNFDYSTTFPSLRTLAIDRDSLGRNAPGPHDLSTLPYSLQHLRLEFPDTWTSREALSFLLTVPQGLVSLEVYLGNPALFSIPEEMERRTGWMEGTKVSWSLWPEEPVDIEEWMPLR